MLSDKLRTGSLAKGITLFGTLIPASLLLTGAINSSLVRSTQSAFLDATEKQTRCANFEYLRDNLQVLSVNLTDVSGLVSVAQPNQEQTLRLVSGIAISGTCKNAIVGFHSGRLLSDSGHVISIPLRSQENSAPADRVELESPNIPAKVPRRAGERLTQAVATSGPDGSAYFLGVFKNSKSVVADFHELLGFRSDLIWSIHDIMALSFLPDIHTRAGRISLLVATGRDNPIYIIDVEWTTRR